jgi:hypothetical protein
MNILYYVGAIISNLGVASLAILLVLVRTKVQDEVKRSDYETSAALGAFIVLIFGVLIQIIGLFDLLKI